MNAEQKKLLVVIGNNLASWNDKTGAPVNDIGKILGLSQNETLKIASSMNKALFNGNLPREDGYFELSPYGWQIFEMLNGL